MRDLAPSTLADLVGVVSQETFLHHTSIRQNLLLARPDASDDVLWWALATAQIADLVGSLPDGLDTTVGARGHRFSGGEQQRVGLDRALARGAGLHLFDEPTAHLDGPLRDRLLGEIAMARREAGAAGIYATHDTAEALAIADRVVLLRDGRIVQAGTPTEVYEAPVDTWAARLTGPASELEAVLVGAIGDLHELDLAGVRTRATLDCSGGGVLPASGEPVRLLVRPDWAALGGTLPGRIGAVRFRGSHTDLDLATPAGAVTIRRPGPPSVAAGDEPGWTLRRARVL